MSLGDWQKKALIRNHPFFSQLTNEEIEKFASLAVETHVSPEEVIVQEGDPVDSIYLIESGNAEVRHLLKKENKEEVIPLAVLNPGEGIGISDVGLYSKTGKRTATVVAMTPMVLIRIGLEDFNHYLKTSPHLNKTLQDNDEIMMRVNLIKQTASFANLTDDQMSWLSDQVKPLSVKAGQLIFNKGDIIDKCYLIYTGEVEIFIPEKNSAEKKITTLTSQKIFGENSLLMNLPTHFSARALQDTELLTLSQALFEKTISAENDSAKTILELMEKDAHPAQLKNTEHFIQQADDKEILVTLKNVTNEKFYKLSEEGWYIWQMLDGKHSFRDITMTFYHKYHLFEPGLIANLLVDLEKKGFIEISPGSYQKQKSETLTKISSFSFRKPNEFITKWYNKGIYLLFSPPLQLLLLAIVLGGLTSFVLHFNRYTQLLLANIQNSAPIIIIALLLFFIRRILHEFAHAFTIKALGHQVKSFGMKITWFGPVAFCDNSDMWLSSKWQRIAVDLSGVYIDLLMAGIVSLIVLALSNPFIILILWIFALLNYLAVLFHLSPLVELDGYYALMDASGKESLRESAVDFLAGDTATPVLQKKAEILFWLISILYVIVLGFIIYLISNIFLNILFKTQNLLISIGISVAIVFLSSLTILKNRRST